MPLTQITFALPLLIAALTGCALVWYAVRKRRIAYGGLLIVCAAMSLIWLLLYLLELTLPDYGSKRVLLNLRYFVIPYISPLMLMIVLRLTGARRTSRPVLMALFAIPVLSSVACWTNPWHGLFYKTMGVRVFGHIGALTSEYGVGYHILSIYSLCIAAYSALRVLMAFRRLNKLYSKQSTIILASIILPALCNATYIAELTVFDFTPVALIVSVYLWAWLLYDFSFCDTLPQPRVKYMDEMDSAIFQLSEDRLVLDMNAAACSLLNKHSADILFQDIGALFRSIGVKPEFKDDEEFRVSKGAVDTYYAMHSCKLSGSALLQVFDVSERKRMEEKSYYFANFDTLTALPNRNLFFKLLQRELDNVKRFGDALILMIIDIDRFQDINELYGYAAGDRVIVELSKRLGDKLRKIDTVARFENDEFHVILPKISNLELDMPVIIDRIFSAFASPVPYDGNAIEFTISIGMAIAPNDGASADELLSSAQTALSSRQTKNRNSYCVYSPELERNIEQSLENERNIRQALEKGEITYAFQFIRDGSGKAAYAQAEVYWKREHRLLSVFPNQALSSLASDIDLHIIHSLCAKAHVNELGGASLIIPLAYSQLINTDFVLNIRKSIKQFAIRPGELVFLVQAAALRQQNECVQSGIKSLLDAGAVFALSGFETSLAMTELLISSGIERVRLSEYLVGHVEEKACSFMIESAIALAGSVGLEIHACGVDSQRQHELLRRLGITLMSGKAVPEGG